MRFPFGSNAVPWDEILSWIVEFSLAGTAVLLIAILVAFSLTKKRASVQHAIWLASLAFLLFTPLLVLVLPRPTIRLSTVGKSAPSFDMRKDSEDRAISSVRSFSAEQPFGVNNELALPLADSIESPSVGRHNVEPAQQAESALVAAPSVTIIRKPWAGWPFAIASVWMLGALVCCVRLAVSCIWLSRFKHFAGAAVGEAVERQATQIAERVGITRKVDLRFSSDDSMPMAFGFLLPCVLVPARLQEFAVDERELILLHELGHLRRRDPLWQFAVELAGVFFWFHPLYWLAKSRCEVTREQACDDLVLRNTSDPGAYAKCLLKVTATANRHKHVSGLGIAMSCRRIESRLKVVLDDSTDRRPLNRVAGLSIMLFLFFLMMPVLALRVAAETPQPTSVESASTAVRSSESQDSTPQETIIPD
ncbi:MAG: M56 family metallopeptidase, partial [Planctomycetota bacterium]